MLREQPARAHRRRRLRAPRHQHRLRHGAGPKLHAWLDTWYPPQRHHLAAPGTLRALAHSVLSEAPDERKAHAAHLADLAEAAARAAYARLFDPIDPEDKTP